MSNITLALKVGLKKAVLHIKEWKLFTTGVKFYGPSFKCLKCAKMPKVPKIKEFCPF
jgi:hypothetical protein